MSAPKEIQDCYFFYYSTCRKGDRCPYRHEQAALGHEVVCQKWRDGQCFDAKCGYRHMVIEKLRRDIPCYWESKPSGCQKPHCVFKHTTARPGDEQPAKVVNGSSSSAADAPTTTAKITADVVVEEVKESESSAAKGAADGDGQPDKVSPSAGEPAELNNNKAAAAVEAVAPATAVDQ